MTNEFMTYGKTVHEVLSHRGECEDWELDANIGFILLEKEDEHGLAAFTEPERYVYAVEGMLREVNNGGFDQYFYNSSGELAFDLVPALEAINAEKVIGIVQRALDLFGTPESLGADSRAEHLLKITEEGDLQLWEECDSDFYDLDEPLEPMLLDYMEYNIDSFDS